MKIISIIGHKNVGKSSLFNFLIKSNLSTNINYFGYTRDCVSANVKIGSTLFKIIDTPGLDKFNDKIEFLSLKKVWTFIKSSDIIIFLTDIFNLRIIDKKFLSVLDKIKNKKIYVVNKIDLINDYDRHNLVRKFLFISIKKKIGLHNLISNILSIFEADNFDNKEVSGTKLIVLGKPNVGKSCFLNMFTNNENSIVFDQDGTTRDILVNKFFNNNQLYTIIDTPGIKNNFTNSLDNYFLKKITNIIKYVDIIFFVLDISKEMLKSNLNIINYFFKFNKILILILNKCDLVNKSDVIFINNIVLDNKKFFKNFDYFFVSSKYGFGIKNLFDHLNKIKRVKTKIDSNYVSSFLKKLSMFDNFLFIKKIQIIKYFPLLIELYIKKQISYSYKKYLTSFFIKRDLYFKNIPVKLIFK